MIGEPTTTAPVTVQAIEDALGTAAMQLAAERAAVAFCEGAGRGDGFDARFARAEVDRLERVLGRLRARHARALAGWRKQ